MAQARNPYSRSWLWIPGSRFARPGKTVIVCIGRRSILYLRKIRYRPRRGADFIQQLQSVLAHLSVLVVDLDLVEKRIDRRPQFCDGAHRAREVFAGDGGTGFRLHLIDRLRQRPLLSEAVERSIGRAVIGLAVLLLLDAQDIRGTLGAREQIPAVIGIEEFTERFDATDHH